MLDARSRRLVVEFTKMTGAGNDFIVVDNRFYHFSGSELAGLARRYCPRRTGIGADGLLALEESGASGLHFRMRYRNADGSLGTMCGNGARCLARYAFHAGMRRDPLRFETDAGIYEARVPEDDALPVRLHLPAPADYRPIAADAHPDLPEGAYAVWTGTEHLVVFVPSVGDVPVATVGPRLRHAAFAEPAGVNVDFVEVEAPGRLRVRTFEKGVEEETLACGTGATAAAVVACLTGRAPGGHVDVRMAGGTLGVGIEGPPMAPDGFYLEGPAETVFRGTIEWG